MPGSRTIPTVVGAARFRVLVQGTALPSTLPLLSVQVSQAIDKISYAKLVLQDYGPAGEVYTQSNSETFLPGNEVEIQAGSVDAQQTIFKGIITRHGIRLRRDNGPELVLECRHVLTRATLVRKSRVFANMKDSEVLNAVLQPYLGGATPNVEASAVIHSEMVQYQATDWDFLLARAQANGMVVMLQTDSVDIRKPITTGSATYTLTAGASLIELDAEIDGRIQLPGVEARAWDPAGQSVASQEGSASIAEPGDLDAAGIAGQMQGENQVLWHHGAAPEPELKAWADASLQKARLSKIRGRAMIDGLSDFRLGGLVTINDAGNRYNGNAWISGIQHTYDNQYGWKTQLQLGDYPEWWLAEQASVHAPQAAALLPAVPGLQVGVVTDLAGDPAGEMRVKVRLPALGADSEPVWARMALADAGSDRGLYFRPEVGDEVIVGFLGADPRYPVVLGGLHSSAKASPISPSNDNHQKGYQSRSGIKWIFDDDQQSVTAETPAGNKLVLNDQDQGITLEDQHGNKIEMGPQGIKIQTTMKLELAAAQLAIAANASAEIKASGNMTLEGSGSVSLKGSGVVTIQGSLVNIN